MIRTIAALGAVALLGACATTRSVADAGEDPAVTKALAGRTPGTPRDCLPLSEARQSTTYRGTILYRVSNRLIYRNDMNGCATLTNDRIPIVQVYGSQICRGDIVRLADRFGGGLWGGCSFGSFVPYASDSGGN